ncbi:MAG: TonB-dependent receptor [Vicinamibacterales bacterium]
MRGRGLVWLVFLVGLLLATAASAQSIVGTVRDEAGGVLPGVVVTIHGGPRDGLTTATDNTGTFRLDVGAGSFDIDMSLVNFSTVRRTAAVPASGTSRLNVVLRYVLNADVTVTGKQTFTNLADADHPAEDLVGIAQSASQGAITARQLDARPIMRSGEVLETVPGVVISQHSGEGKANQYYLRGFNLDHGTDFATTLAGMPVNMPSHGHGQGYSDLNFMIPELVSGVQFEKGPYFADQGDFATTGSATITYTSSLDTSIAQLTGGQDGFARALVATSPALGEGHLLVAADIGHNDGPWLRPDAFRKVNGVIRYSGGNAANGFVVTGMGYHARWNSTDQIPRRAISTGTLDRFASVDNTDGGDTYRYSASAEWQRARANGVTKVVGYGIAYNLNLFSDFTYFLDDPVNGDQFHQADHRFVSGGRISHRRIGRLAGRDTQNTIGVQVRNDRIGRVALTHTRARMLLDTVLEDAVLETSAAIYAQNETTWTPWLRSLAGLRTDAYRFRVTSSAAANSGVRHAAIVSPKGGLVIGPFHGTEFYVNAGVGFHSNDARGTTITRDPSTGERVEPVTPLVRAAGSELGVRTVALPHLQSTLTLWTLSLDSELVFSGDAGTTEVGRPSRRYGVEFANYYTPRPWLIVDGDISWSQAHFSDDSAIGTSVPGAVQTVVSSGNHARRPVAPVRRCRLRYFGPRPLVEDNSPVERDRAESTGGSEGSREPSPVARSLQRAQCAGQ